MGKVNSSDRKQGVSTFSHAPTPRSLKHIVCAVCAELYLEYQANKRNIQTRKFPSGWKMKQALKQDNY